MGHHRPRTVELTASAKSTPLAHILNDVSALVIDFDGPVCSVFSGLPAPTVAAQIRLLLTEAVGSLPDDVAAEDDPLELLRQSATYGPGVLSTAEATLNAAELRAVVTAAPTPFARETLIACKSRGIAVGIASNNSAPAIDAYLGQHGLAWYVASVNGRPAGNPALMKPNPFVITSAVAQLGTERSRCVLIGDTTTDVAAARAAGVRCIGYANRPGKYDALVEAGADAVTVTMSDVAAVLDTRPA
jgi:HAD superfamily hydrolase (TIGR01509 family)